MNEYHSQQKIIVTGGESDHHPQLVPGFGVKRLYVSPVLKHQAHLRDITLAPSVGVHESGVGDGRKAKTLSFPLGGDSEPGSSRGAGEIFENDIFGG